jgi:hypothetical protein
VREIRQHGSEGGGPELNRASLPLSTRAEHGLQEVRPEGCEALAARIKSRLPCGICRTGGIQCTENPVPTRAGYRTKAVAAAGAAAGSRASSTRSPAARSITFEIVSSRPSTTVVTLIS